VVCVYLILDLGLIEYILTYHSLFSSDIIPLHMQFKKITKLHTHFSPLHFSSILVYLVLHVTNYRIHCYIFCFKKSIFLDGGARWQRSMDIPMDKSG
jgi:hypothetical protein